MTNKAITNSPWFQPWAMQPQKTSVKSNHATQLLSLGFQSRDKQRRFPEQETLNPKQHGNCYKLRADLRFIKDYEGKRTSIILKILIQTNGRDAVPPLRTSLTDFASVSWFPETRNFANTEPKTDKPSLLRLFQSGCRSRLGNQQ